MDNEAKRIKGGSFKTMGLQKQLFYNVAFPNPTPIQRLTIPLILEERSIMGIARTGSGKTLAYLLPITQRAIEGANALILLPTKELALQVRRIFKNLSYKVPITGRIEITTLKDIDVKDFDILVVDEIDRIMEEKSLAAHFEKIRSNFSGQRIYFSATLPDEPLDIKVVQIESKLPEGITHHFYYVSSDSKDSALLNVLDKEKRTIIFVATRYGVEFLLAVLAAQNYEAKGIYSSMDDDARRDSFDAFLGGRVQVLVVTDVAARGLDIPRLDAAILYDMCDEKTFVHRVGRIRGMGDQHSLVTYSDVFHFFNIRETHVPDAVIGTIPQEILDRYNLSGLAHLRGAAMRGAQRCLDFRRKVSVPSEFKQLIEAFEVHPRFKGKETLADQLKRINRRKPTEMAVPKMMPSYKDQFYIPYAKQEKSTHSSAFAVFKDDYLKERKPRESRNNRWKQTKTL